MTKGVYLSVIAVLGAIPANAQPQLEPLSRCRNLNQTVAEDVAQGRLAEADSAVSAALAESHDSERLVCAGIALSNIGVLLSYSGRLSEAQTYAERSLKILEVQLPPDHIILTAPLRVIYAVRFQHGEFGRAREVFKRMEAIPKLRPEDRALECAARAALFDVEGKRSEAESEYLAALHLWENAGRQDSVDVAFALVALGSLYVKEERFNDSRQALDRALAIYSRNPGAAPIDRIKILQVLGAMHARQKDWRAAEGDLREAVSLAEGQNGFDEGELSRLLSDYEYVLRRNHHGREARLIQKRVAALNVANARVLIVDKTELLSNTAHNQKK